ncbi:hypothetical protein BDN72DRAFT_903992 [Pluteus cervinus]|uniref:Uncharacterized protein n=1 Tax=Pluteus cervinus TaxID=181527 RepID=A0ACD3A7A8_9AGAR|nr:hypothetical protein BDN72DRAFT_903992 [Pluteus cervinus]
MTSGKSKRIYYPSQSDGTGNSFVSSATEDKPSSQTSSQGPVTITTTITTTTTSLVPSLEIDFRLLAITSPQTPDRRDPLTAGPSGPQQAQAPITLQDLAKNRPEAKKTSQLKWYAVVRGRKTGFFQNWKSVEPFVKKKLADGRWGPLHPKSYVVGFDEMEDAMHFMDVAEHAASGDEDAMPDFMALQGSLNISPLLKLAFLAKVTHFCGIVAHTEEQPSDALHDPFLLPLPNPAAPPPPPLPATPSPPNPQHARSWHTNLPPLSPGKGEGPSESEEQRAAAEKTSYQPKSRPKISRSQALVVTLGIGPLKVGKCLGLLTNFGKVDLNFIIGMTPTGSSSAPLQDGREIQGHFSPPHATYCTLPKYVFDPALLVKGSATKPNRIKAARICGEARAKRHDLLAKLNILFLRLSALKEDALGGPVSTTSTILTALVDSLPRSSPTPLPYSGVLDGASPASDAKAPIARMEVPDTPSTP